MDEILLYRAGNLVVDDDITVNSLNTTSLLVNGADVRPMFFTKLSTANINAANSNPILMDPFGGFTNMAGLIFKQSTSTLEVATAGQYYISLSLNCTSSSSSSQIQFLNGLSVISTGNISAADSGVNLTFIATLAVGDLLTMSAVRISGSSAKNLFLTSSILNIIKL